MTVATLINKFSILRSRLKYNGIAFSLVSNNCWGSEIYPILGLKYLTPFVGLFLYPSCYIRLLSNFTELINQQLIFTDHSKYRKNGPDYPVGILGNKVEIHFMHYGTKEEAGEKWNKRVRRLVKDQKRLFFKFDDSESCTDEQIIAFHRLNFGNKFSFTKNKLLEFANNFKLLPEHIGFDGLELFRVRNQYFDLIRYINESRFKKNKYHIS